MSEHSSVIYPEAVRAACDYAISRVDRSLDILEKSAKASIIAFHRIIMAPIHEITDQYSKDQKISALVGGLISVGTPIATSTIAINEGAGGTMTALSMLSSYLIIGGMTYTHKVFRG